jgi:class 3 adenylate cyclase
MGGGNTKLSAPLSGSLSRHKKWQSGTFTSNQDTFTSLEDELNKPLDGSDLNSGLANEEVLKEVKRLRKLIFSESKKAASMHRHHTPSHRISIVSRDMLYGQGKENGSNDEFETRWQRKKEIQSKMRKSSSSNTSEAVLNLMKDSHRHVQLVANSVQTSSGESISVEDDAHAHAQKFVHCDYSDRNVAILVSDLRGFTSTTRKYGIVHFASIIVRMRQLVLPIFAQYKALNINTEADNFITVFPDAQCAVLAALNMKVVLEKYNDSLSDDRQHFKVRLNGIGVSCGKDVLLDTEGNLHGKPAHDAYHIGEDVCANGVVLVTPFVATEIDDLIKSGAINVIDFKNEKEDPGTVFKHVSIGTMPMEPELVSTDDLRYLPKQLSLFASRHDPATDITSVDMQIANQFKTTYTAMMYHLDVDSVEEHGALQLIVLQAISLSILRPVFSKFNAIELEPELFVFHDACDAVLAVLDAKTAIEHYNSNLPEEHKNDAINIHGWGIHHGTMIFVDGTDIHWGDPVNTASKLGQDLAQNGDLLISKSVEELIRDNPILSAEGGVQFESRMLKRSNVDFPAFCVQK